MYDSAPPSVMPCFQNALWTNAAIGTPDVRLAGARGRSLDADAASISPRARRSSRASRSHARSPVARPFHRTFRARATWGASARTMRPPVPMPISSGRSRSMACCSAATARKISRMTFCLWR